MNNLVTKIYKILISMGSTQKLNSQTRREMDCNRGIEDFECNQIWTSYSSKSRIFSISFQFYKLVSRWYITPASLKRMKVMLLVGGGNMVILEICYIVGKAVCMFKNIGNKLYKKSML